jgi:hypothetical protein
MSARFEIAVLLATRGRTDLLMRSLRSLVDLAHDPSSMQIMLAFDRDDSVGVDYFVKTVQPWLDQEKIHYRAELFDPMGYVNLHKYNNALAQHTNSNWLVIWNDDAVMETQDWDQVIASYTGQFRLLAFHTHRDHPYSIFPIVPREWYDTLGYISPHPTQDGWVSQQAYMLDIWQRIPVHVLHDRYDLTGNNADETFRNRPMLEGKPSDPRDFHSQDMIALRHRDAARLAEHMQKRNISIEFFQKIFMGQQDPWEKLAQNDVNSQMVQFKNPHAHYESRK